VVGVFLPILGATLFLFAGGMPVATKGPPLPLETRIAHLALNVALGDAEKVPSPVGADENNLIAGAKIYHRQCAVCHGEPGIPASAIAKGLFPQPPRLFEKKGVTDDEVGETYWKVKNGIRLTGMPGFVDSLSETELWQVSQLLRNAHSISPAVKSEFFDSKAH
jgi:thiosulfate dehydrogenase